MLLCVCSGCARSFRGWSSHCSLQIKGPEIPDRLRSQGEIFQSLLLHPFIFDMIYPPPSLLSSPVIPSSVSLHVLLFGFPVVTVHVPASLNTFLFYFTYIMKFFVGLPVWTKLLCWPRLWFKNNLMSSERQFVIQHKHTDTNNSSLICRSSVAVIIDVVTFQADI